MVWTGLFKGLMMDISIFAPYFLFLLALFSIKILFRRYQRRQLLESQRSIETLRALSWREFERLVGEAYRRQGYTVVERGGSGGDGGVDLELHRGPEKIAVQCKRWKTWTVGAPVVRELLGAMVAEGATAGIVVTSGRFTRDAIGFARGKPITLVDGPQLLALVQSVQTAIQTSVPPYAGVPPAGPASSQHLPAAEQPPAPAQSLPATQTAVATAPHCPACGTIMVRRTARKGVNAGQEFWGCPDYPRCRGTRPG